MSNEIEIGEYGRTNKGVIFIFVWLTNEGGEKYTHKVLLGDGKCFNNKLYYFDEGEEIVKHSRNILNILEAKDYVNGMQIDEFDDEEGNSFLGIPIYDDSLMDCIEEVRPLSTIEIKSILTKEQYEQNCYKLKEE